MMVCQKRLDLDYRKRQKIYGAAELGGGSFAQESGKSSEEVEEASLYGQRD